MTDVLVLLKRATEVNIPKKPTLPSFIFFVLNAFDCLDAKSDVDTPPSFYFLFPWLKVSPRMNAAWHAWARTNHELVKVAQTASAEAKAEGRAEAKPLSEEALLTHVVAAISGFAHSIRLGQGKSVANVLQDTLRLLTLWFAFGQHASVHAAAEQGLALVRAEVWLEVVPQLIARLDHPHPNVATLLTQLLQR